MIEKLFDDIEINAEASLETQKGVLSSDERASSRNV